MFKYPLQKSGLCSIDNWQLARALLKLYVGPDGNFDERILRYKPATIENGCGFFVSGKL